MKNSCTLAVIFILTIAIAGCSHQMAQRMKTLPEGHFAESAKLAEDRIKERGAARSSDLIELCSSLSNLKQYNRLFSCLDQLEENIKKGDKQGVDNMASSMWGLEFYFFPLGDVSTVPYLLRAQAHIELGNYLQAIAAAQKAYELADETAAVDQMCNWERRIRIRSLGLISLAYALDGKPDKAKHYLAQLEDTSPGFLGMVPVKKEKNRVIARVCMALGDYEKILSDRSGFFEGFTKTVGKMIYAGDLFAYTDLPYRFMVGKAMLETGKTEEARKEYDDLLKIPGTSQNGEIYWMILYDRGQIAEKEGRLDQAIGFYTQAIEVIEGQRSTIHTEAGKIGFVGDKQLPYHAMIRTLYRDQQYGKAFEYVERSKSRALVDLLATKKDFAVKGGSKQEVLAALSSNDAVEAELILQDASIDKRKTRSIQIITRDTLKAKAPDLASLVAVTAPSISEIHPLIAADEALIEYYYRDNDLYAFILSGGKIQAIKLNGEGLAKDVQELRKLLGEAESMQFMDVSKKLYKRLFQPLEGFLGKRNLLVVSHGVLHYLPMNALHNGTHYLIDCYSIRMMPSAVAMKYLGERKPVKEKRVLILGNPDLGNSTFDLEYAQKEATEIAAVRPGSRVFLKKEASEGVLRKYASDYRYIHFATHGQFNSDAPLKSSLLLAPDSRYDGMLTVDKLYSLPLDADLVTLSACETGLSKIANGDDLVGLTRGFLYAGSSSIVASLWKVDDLATSFLMTHFYRNLDGTNKREALRNAQLKTKEKYPHPYYWAAFQLTGSAN